MPQPMLASSLPGSAEAAGQFWLRVTNLALLAAFLTRAVPETLLFEISIAGIPLPFCVFFCACTAAALSSVLSPRRWFSAELAVGAVMCVYMGVLGYMNRTELKFLVIDSTYFIALLLGLQWTAQRGIYESLGFIRLLYASTTLVLFLSCLGLVTGAIPSANYGTRLYSFSIFGSSTLICTLTPLVCSTLSVRTSRVQAVRWLRWTLFGLGTVLMAAVISATRSMLLVWMCSLAATVWLKMTGRNGVIYASGLLLLSPLALSMLAVANLENTQIAQRLHSTELDEELRYQELEMMYEDLRDDLYIGKGFGSRFATPIGAEQIAFAPHIGITTLLYKGGVIVFALVIVFPVLYAAWSFLGARGSGSSRIDGRRVAAGCVGGILINAAQASLSGGWDYQHLFQFAMLFGLSRIAFKQSAAIGVRPHFRREATAAPRLESAA
jgi:hypothetical protein